MQTFRVQRLSDYREFALKFVQDFHLRFYKEQCNTEIETLKKIGGSNPNIVKLVDYAVGNNMETGQESMYIILQWCPSGNLKDLIERNEMRGCRKLTEEEIVRVMYDVSNAVFELHKLDEPIAHRNIKVRIFFFKFLMLTFLC